MTFFLGRNQTINRFAFISWLFSTELLTTITKVLWMWRRSLYPIPAAGVFNSRGLDIELRFEKEFTFIFISFYENVTFTKGGNQVYCNISDSYDYCRHYKWNIIITLFILLSLR